LQCRTARTAAQSCIVPIRGNEASSCVLRRGRKDSSRSFSSSPSPTVRERTTSRHTNVCTCFNGKARGADGPVGDSGVDDYCAGPNARAAEDRFGEHDTATVAARATRATRATRTGTCLVSNHLVSTHGVAAARSSEHRVRVNCPAAVGTQAASTASASEQCVDDHRTATVAARVPRSGDHRVHSSCVWESDGVSSRSVSTSRAS